MSGLLKLKEYSLFTFISTAQALKAERILKTHGLEYLMIPTPRELSTSCGLSIKVFPGDLECYQEILKQEQIALEQIFHVSPEGVEDLSSGQTSDG